MEMHAYNARKLYVRIAQQIRSAIEAGELRPGDRMQPLAELAERFGCSRATVREALGALRGQGLVEFRHGNGTYVRTAALEMWMEPLEAAILLGRGDVKQLVDMQVAVMAGIATSVANQFETLDFGDLSQALFAVECAPPRGEELVAAQLSFYMALAVACGNALFENALRVLQEALRSMLRLQDETGLRAKQVCRDVFDAIRSGDGARAREVLYAYGQAVQDDLLKMTSSPEQ